MLLMRHTEALLLVHDQKAEVFKMHVFGQQPVRPDDQIALAVFQIPQGLGISAAVAQPAQSFNFNREAKKALEGGLVMLLGQNCGRNQDGCLLSVQDALHHRAESDFRLSETDVSAEQPIHRNG